MNEAFSADDFVARVLAMRTTQHVRFLARYGHELTILARVAFLDDDYESARACNETLHRILGHIGAVLTNTDATRDERFARMLVESADQRGRADLLVRSLGIAT
jgi:NAD(P)-dependent dehydrogenase (short-subunit alcohol dehydrogenase family)